MLSHTHIHTQLGSKNDGIKKAEWTGSWGRRCSEKSNGRDMYKPGWGGRGTKARTRVGVGSHPEEQPVAAEAMYDGNARTQGGTA